MQTSVPKGAGYTGGSEPSAGADWITLWPLLKQYEYVVTERHFVGGFRLLHLEKSTRVAMPEVDQNLSTLTSDDIQDAIGRFISAGISSVTGLKNDLFYNQCGFTKSQKTAFSKVISGDRYIDEEQAKILTDWGISGSAEFEAKDWLTLHQYPELIPFQFRYPGRQKRADTHAKPAKTVHPISNQRDTEQTPKVPPANTPPTTTVDVDVVVRGLTYQFKDVTLEALAEFADVMERSEPPAKYKDAAE